MVEKSLDIKLKRILSDPACRDFILADAKDADMAFGIAAPGRSPEQHAHEGRFRTLAEYRELIRQNVTQGLVDIMLMSASTNELLTIRERLFENSHVTPAVRANDTTDIWLARGGAIAGEPSRPFRSTTIDHAMCGKVECSPGERGVGADLGLYSVTFNNDRDADRESLEAYKQFRTEAEAKGFRHFLEVFDPNAPKNPVPEMGKFINDMIVRALAGAVGKGRPLFLKIAYHGPAAMEELCGYDRSLVVGILGGSSGTTFDAFHQLWEAKKYGARVALYGRMINNAENQLAFVKHLRAVADDAMTPAEAVKSYHAELARLFVKPYRSLEDDLKATKRASAYSGRGGTVRSTTTAKLADAAQAAAAANGEAEPDFAKMTPAEKVAWNRARWNRILG